MQQVIAYLQKDYQIFLFGAGQNEVQKLIVWEKAYTYVFNTAGKSSLLEQIQLMPYLDLMISMDSLMVTWRLTLELQFFLFGG